MSYKTQTTDKRNNRIREASTTAKEREIQEELTQKLFQKTYGTRKNEQKQLPESQVLERTKLEPKFRGKRSNQPQLPEKKIQIARVCRSEIGIQQNTDPENKEFSAKCESEQTHEVLQKEHKNWRNWNRTHNGHGITNNHYTAKRKDRA